MINSYRVTVGGTTGDGQTWETVNIVACEFHDAFEVGMRDSFARLTGGRAVFGKPGVGCRGPYEIDRVLIEKVK